MSDEQEDRVSASDFSEGSTPEWLKGLPEALVKAVGDQPFEYALMLRDGTVIEFEGAEPQRVGWILLDRPRIVNRGYNACFERGLEVRLDEIVLVSDAPHGS